MILKMFSLVTSPLKVSKSITQESKLLFLNFMSRYKSFCDVWDSEGQRLLNLSGCSGFAQLDVFLPFLLFSSSRAITRFGDDSPVCSNTSFSFLLDSLFVNTLPHIKDNAEKFQRYHTIVITIKIIFYFTNFLNVSVSCLGIEDTTQTSENWMRLTLVRQDSLVAASLYLLISSSCLLVCGSWLIF